MIDEKFVPPADAVVENNTQNSFVPPSDAIVKKTPAPKQEAPVSQTPAPKQKSNVEAPKFVAPTKVAPINPKTITPSTTPAYDKRKLAQDETDVEGNFQKRQQEIENEYRYKMSALRNQGRDVSKPLNVTFKLGEQTFSVKNPQMNILSLQNEKAKKIEANKNNYVKQKGKVVVGQKQKELLDDNAYTQTVLNDELEGLKSDRQYYANLLQGGYENILTGKPEVQYNIKEGATPRINYPAVKPEILQQFELKSTGNNNRDYELVKQAITEKISEIDADVSSANINLGISKTDSKNLKNQVDYLKNLNTSNTSDILLSASTYNPKIGELQKKAAKQVGDVTSVDIASADVKKDEQPFFSTETAMKFLANINPIGSSASTILSGLFNMSKEGFFKKVNYRNLGAEKTELTSIDAAVKTSDALLQNRLRKSYDEISSQFNVDSEKVKELALGIMKISDSMQPNQKLAPPKDMDPALFYGLIESPQFTKILNTYMNSSDVFDINGKKERIALAETNKVMQQKAKEFGTLAKMQKDVEREQAFVDVLNKKSKDASILSNDFYNKLAYETAYTLTYGKSTVKEMAGGVAKVGETLVEDVTKTPLSNITKANIDELVYSTDLYDALVPTNSALNLGLFNPNKFIPMKDASGKNLSIEVDGNGKLINIHAEDYAYVVRDPKQREAIEKYYKENKDELSLTALPLSKTEGGKRAIFDDTFRKVGKEVIQEAPTMAFEIGSGGVAGALIKGNKLRKVAQYGIAATSNMIETYPMVYKGYMENTDDPNNPYAAMLTTGALGLVSLWTSSLDRKLISLGERAVSKEVLPEIIENAAPVIRAISKETAKIADKNLRDITFKSAVNKFLSRETLQAFKPAFRRVAAKAGEMGIETGGEVAEETVSEPLTQFATNFFNAAIFNNQAYKQQTLDDLNFLDPETAWLTFWTAGAISTGGNIAESIQKNNPYTQVDYLKAALKNPDKVEQMLVNIEEDNSPEVMQKIREDYQALKTSYDDKKKELNISQDLLETLDFNNPAVKIILGQAGISANVIDNIKGSKNYDALIIQQIVEEKKTRDLEANIQEGVSQGLIVQTEDGYKAVGNNPLSKPYEKTISDFEKAKTNLQYFDNFVRDFNTKTAPIQRQFMDELQQSLVVAPDLYDVKNENEDESSIYYNVNAFNNLRNATLAKLVNQARLAEIETEMIGSEDKEKLQQEKANVTEAIKQAENTINTIQKQYKPGRTETNEEFQKATETAELDQIALVTALNDVSNKIDVEDVNLDNHEINDIYDKYVKSMEEREKVATKLRDEYGVNIPKTNIVSREQFEKVKEQIVKRRELGKKLKTNQSTLADLRAFVGAVDENSKMEPETADDIDEILNDESQVLMYADDLNLPDTLPYSKVKEEVSVQLHERLRQTAADNAEEALGINEILTTKIDKTTGQNTTYIIDGEEYTVANRPNSNVVTITDEQKAQVVIDELGREIARRLFSDSMALTPETLDAIRNKVLEESYPELDLEIDDATMELIAANIINLKLQFEAQGIEVLFNDKVISSKFTTIPESENSIVGIASKIPLIAITPEGEIHLISFKLFTGTTYSNVNTFEDEMTTIKALFEDNKVQINGIHTLPINVKMEVKDGVVTVDKTEINEVRVSNEFNQGLIPLKTNVALENEILDSIEVRPVVEEEVVEEETPTSVAPVEPVLEPQTPEFEGIEPTSEPVEPVSRTPVYNVGGTSNGVYITVEEKTLANKTKIYKIKIDNNPELNDVYKKQVFNTLGEVKAEYEKNNWFIPKDINTNRTYSLQDSEGNSIKSPVQTTLSNVINDFSFVTEGVGSEVSIVELEDVNDNADVQANFVDKARLVVRLGDDNITEIPFGSPIRKKLQTVQVDGKTRLAPTTANISKVIQKDFDRTAPMLLEDWLGDFEANNDGPFTYDVGYVQFERDRYVLKNTDNKTIYTYPINEEPVLGATYLIVTDANNIRTRFALQTPKLQDVVLSDGSKITKSDVIELMKLVPTQAFKEKGKELYLKVVEGLEEVITKSNNPRIIEFANLVAKEIGSESTPGRAASTEELLNSLSNLPAYTEETKDDNNNIIADFFLNRIITLTPESVGKHLITTNPKKVYLDNKLEVNNLVSGDYNEVQEAPRFQVATAQETPQDVVREMVDTLKGTGLANEVFEMTAEELDAKLQEIGFSEEVRKQVLSSMLEKDINVDGVITKVKPIDVDVVNGFYSPLEKIISESKQDKMPVKQWMDKFAKGEEAKWTGLTDWLSQQEGSVSKADIQNYLKDNRIEIVEVVKGEALIYDEQNDEYNIEGTEIVILKNEEGSYDVYDAGFAEVEDIETLEKAKSTAFDIQRDNYNKIEGNTKFSQYQLEGEKENYKEVLVTMPDNGKSNTELNKISNNKFGKDFSDLTASQRMELDVKSDFKSSHFDEPNILVHLRMNTRTDADGNKVLFLEEVQSDWGQQGKKEGFNKKILPNDIEILNDEPTYYDDEAGGTRHRVTLKVKGYSEVANGAYYPHKETLKQLKERIAESYSKEMGISAAPFVMDTNTWTKLGLKVALKEAVKQGADKIAWTTGEQQNERYDLRKQVDSINYLKNADGTYRVYGKKGDNIIFKEKALAENKLEASFGKDVAEKIINDKGDSKEGLATKVLEGENLSVGGKGMKGFYGSPTEGTKGIVGGVAEKLFKQKLGEVKFSSPKNQEVIDAYNKARSYGNIPDALVEKYEKAKGLESTQPSINVTPELKAEVEQGLPLFQKALQEKGVNLTPTGFTYKGDVYLNMSNMRMDTPIHEFSHLLLDWMKVNKPELYQEGLKKVKAEMGKKDSVIKDVIEFVKTTQPNLTGEALENEILTEVSGRKGVDLLMSGQKSGIIDWLKKFWAEVKNMLGLLDASIEQVANMTLEEYANAMAVQLLKGEQFVFDEVYNKASQFDNFEDFVDSMSDFRDAHTAPSKDTDSVEVRLEQAGDFTLEEVAKGIHNVPKDFFDTKVGPRYYGYDNKEGRESLTAVNNIVRGIDAGKENQKITAYRAIPKDIDVNDLKDYDWITFSKGYAIGHGESRFGEDEYKIIEQEVPITDVWWDGNDINEWGYDTGNTKKYSRRELKSIWETAQKLNLNFQQSNIPQAIERNNGNLLTQAPNGKPSILYQSYKDLGYSDSEAERLTAQVYSDNFISWFGDWINDAENASKVVDENGMPILEFHGTNAEFTSFDVNKMTGKDTGFHFGTQQAAKEAASVKGGNRIIPVFLNIKNKIELEEADRFPTWNGLEIMTKVAEKLDGTEKLTEEQKDLIDKVFAEEIVLDYTTQFGEVGNGEYPYDGKQSEQLSFLNNFLSKFNLDGVSYTNIIEDKGSTSYISFNPNQIKSATENIGTFSTETPDIRFQMATEEETTQIPDCV